MIFLFSPVWIYITSIGELVVSILVFFFLLHSHLYLINVMKSRGSSLITVYIYLTFTLITFECMFGYIFSGSHWFPIFSIQYGSEIAELLTLARFAISLHCDMIMQFKAVLVNIAILTTDQMTMSNVNCVLMVTNSPRIVGRRQYRGFKVCVLLSPSVRLW